MTLNPSDSIDSQSTHRTISEKDTAIRLSVPATIILERRMISRSFWSLPSWYLHTVAVGESLVAADALNGASGMPAGNSDKGELFAWTGFEVTLYKDACERYWHALIGDKPLVYVVCRDETDETDGAAADVLTMHPITVTVDYDDASAAAETDSPVLSAPIPAELYRYMERFVLNHYVPQEFKKRKRRNWSDQEGRGGRPSGQDYSGAGNRGKSHE